MSYDLYFYKRKDSKLTEEGFAKYLSINLRFNISDYARQWNYENPETGVYFLIDWNDSDTEAHDIDMFNTFSDFDNLNFSFSLNFFRADFFGYEVFPIIEKIVTDLDLFLLNPQDETDSENPKKFSPGYLQEQWIRQNSQVTKQNYAELSIKYFDLERSNAIWSYQFIREELQNSLKEDIFVGGILLLQGKTDEKFYTVCVWPKHIPIILPQVDYVIIQKKYSKFFRQVEESGLVPYSEIMKLNDSFQPFEYKGLQLNILNQERADALKKQFNSLPMDKNIVDFGTMVGLDSFVNHKP